MRHQPKTTLLATYAFVLSILFASCGTPGFSGATGGLKTKPKETPLGPTKSDVTPSTENISVSETFRQLRASNTAGKPEYGVGILSLTASGLAAGQKILDIVRTGMSSDVRFFLCTAQGAPEPAATKDGKQLYQQTVDCFLTFKGMKNNPTLHRLYPGIQRVARVGSDEAAKTFDGSSTLCVVPQNETDPCVEKAGRTVIKGIVGGKSIRDFGHEPIDFPADAAVEADLKSIPK